MKTLGAIAVTAMRCAWSSRAALGVLPLFLAAPAYPQNLPQYGTDWALVCPNTRKVEVCPPNGSWIELKAPGQIAHANGYKVRTDKSGSCQVMMMDDSIHQFGPGTTIVLADLVKKVPSEGAIKLKREFEIQRGNVRSAIDDAKRGVYGGKVRQTIRTVKQLITNKKTDFTVSHSRRIAFVSGGSLWLMGEDGTGATNFIAAPAGRQIGRSAFAPDGSAVVYEAWGAGGVNDPRVCDLWIADGDGGTPRLLFSAGTLAEATAKAPYAYRDRLLMGPSFSPDGRRISFLRIQDYQPSSGLYTREKEICTAPVSGGSFAVLWRTFDVPGVYTFYEVGENTVWLPNDTIAFIRSGKLGVRASAFVDASNTNRTAWPCQIYMEYDSETGVSPVTLRASVEGEALDFSSRLKGYGDIECSASGVWTWRPFGDSWGWNTLQLGAWYGPLTSHDLPAGTNRITLFVNNGIGSMTSQAIDINVVKGGRTAVNRAGNFTFRGPGGGVWAISASGGEPWPVIANRMADSIAWSSDGAHVVLEYQSTPGTDYLALYDAAGHYLDAVVYGDDLESSVGNADAADRYVLAWSGSAGVGRIQRIDTETGDVTDLGAGSFPVYTPLHRTEVAVFEGAVSITDTNGLNEVVGQAGQTVAVDSLLGGGLPQPAVAIAGPYVTNVAPGGGGAVPGGSNVSVRFEFSAPVLAASLLPQRVAGVSWPGPAGQDAGAMVLNALAYTDAVSATNSRASFAVAVSNLQSGGVGTGQWNAAHTAYTLTVTNQGFPRTNGNWCEITLDLSGVKTAGGVALPFGAAATRFQFVDPVGAAGGRVSTVAGGVLQVPAGALAGSVAIGAGYSGHLPAGVNPPVSAPAGLAPAGAGTWQPIGGCYEFTPAAQTFATNAVLSLPIDGLYPGAAIWRYTGAAWTNLGGSYDPAAGMISASIRQLGTFCVFYLEPSGAWLRITLDAGTRSVATNDTITYALLAENIGVAAATNVVVTDVLPVGLIYVTNSASAGGVYSPGTRTITWTLGVLGGLSGVWLEFQARPGPSVPYGAAVTNIASASSVQPGPTNSNAAVVWVGRASGGAPRFGIGSTNSVSGRDVAALGAAYRRAADEISTTEAESTNLLSFAALDAAVRTNQALGCRTYAIVSAAPVGGRWPSPSSFAQAFGLLVQRYDGDGVGDMPGLALPVHEWEVFDAYDPDAARWSGCPLALYAQYLSAVSAVGRAIDPSIAIASSSFQDAPADGTNYLTRLLADYPGAAEAIDAVSVHATYGPGGYWTGSDWEPDYLQARSLVDAASDIRPGLAVWITKADFTSTYDDLLGVGHTCTETEKAQWLAQSVPFALAAGVTRLVYTELESRPADSAALKWSALLDAVGSRRMSYYVYQKLTQRLEGFQSATRLDFGGGRIGVRFIDAGAQPVWVLWNWSNATSQVTLPVGPVAQVRVTAALPDAFTASNATWSTSTGALSGGYASVAVSPSPVFVEPIGYVSPSTDWDVAFGAADPAPFVTTLSATGLPVRLDWHSASGHTYRVEWTPSLSAAWSNVQDGLTFAVGPTSRWLDPGPPKTADFTNQPARFYRVRLAP